MRALLLLVLIGTLHSNAANAQDSWKATEEIKPYSISGTSGFELYRSIGERGPQIAGKRRVIAHTSYVLTWDRKFDHSGNACTIISARPKLKITYTLPKPSKRLSPDIQKNWDTFYKGVYQHELEHGEIAKEMTRDIVQTTMGLSVPNDPKCSKMRKELIKIITDYVKIQRERGQAFDRAEMGSGGNVEQLVLSLVNGG